MVVRSYPDAPFVVSCQEMPAGGAKGLPLAPFTAGSDGAAVSSANSAGGAAAVTPAATPHAPGFDVAFGFDVGFIYRNVRFEDVTAAEEVKAEGEEGPERG